VNVASLRPVPEPQELRHLVLRSGNEDIIGAQVIGKFVTEEEAVAEAEHQLAKTPDFHFWHVVVAHEAQRTTMISSRAVDPHAK
jgi:hypothetical protein